MHSRQSSGPKPSRRCPRCPELRGADRTCTTRRMPSRGSRPKTPRSAVMRGGGGIPPGSNAPGPMGVAVKDWDAIRGRLAEKEELQLDRVNWELWERQEPPGPE